MSKVVHARRSLPVLAGETVDRPQGFDYRAGQCISLTHGNVTRSYSLPSLPQEDDDLELHVKRVYSTLAASGERDVVSGLLTDVLGRTVHDSRERKIYLGGAPDPVSALRWWAVFGSVSSCGILVEPFVAAEAA